MPFEQPQENLPPNDKEKTEGNPELLTNPFMPDSEFRRRFDQQMREDFLFDHTSESGEVIKDIPNVRNREGAIEFIEGLGRFWNKAQVYFDQYWQSTISKTGANYHDKGQFSLDEIGKLKDELAGVDMDIMEHPHRIIKETFLAFDLYACINGLKPDRIVSLVNGAVRLDAITHALGFDSQNYLSIHLKTDNPYRKDLSGDPVYEGKPILHQSTVLILEDTSDLRDERTYKIARKWLIEQGAGRVPVFMERLANLDMMATGVFSVQKERHSIDKFIEIQKELNDDDCYNSYSTGVPTTNPKFWKGEKSKISQIIEADPSIYDSFFEFIRNYK